jgi:FMN-dependent NADH-azoreductase
MKLLHLDSSVLRSHSVSRQLSAAIVERLKTVTPGLEITYRDLRQAAGPPVRFSPRCSTGR